MMAKIVIFLDNPKHFNEKIRIFRKMHYLSHWEGPCKVTCFFVDMPHDSVEILSRFNVFWHSRVLLKVSNSLRDVTFDVFLANNRVFLWRCHLLLLSLPRQKSKHRFAVYYSYGMCANDNKV